MKILTVTDPAGRPVHICAAHIVAVRPHVGLQPAYVTQPAKTLIDTDRGQHGSYEALEEPQDVLDALIRLHLTGIDRMAYDMAKRERQEQEREAQAEAQAMAAMDAREERDAKLDEDERIAKEMWRESTEAQDAPAD